MRPAPRARLTAALLALAALLPAGRASTVVSLSEDDLVDRAHLVARGLVLSVETAMRDQGFPVFRDVVLRVDEVLKGDVEGEILHISLPGGAMDGKMYHVPGVPAFYPGEEVVVFLAPLPNGENTVIGLRQGKYRLVPDASGLVVVERDLSHLNMLATPRPGQTIAQALRSRAPDREEWGSFRRRLRDRIQATGGR